jgi:F0F1-type ATP synthase delta subunit
VASRLSRRTLAKFAADELLAGSELVFDQLAALLIEERREREADILVRDIEAQLAEAGHVVVRVETAHALDDGTRREIETMFAGSVVHIHEVVMPELIGGVRMSTPTQALDQTIARKLETLRMAEI